MSDSDIRNFLFGNGYAAEGRDFDTTSAVKSLALKDRVNSDKINTNNKDRLKRLEDITYLGNNILFQKFLVYLSKTHGDDNYARIQPNTFISNAEIILQNDIDKYEGKPSTSTWRTDSPPIPDRRKMEAVKPNSWYLGKHLRSAYNSLTNPSAKSSTALRTVTKGGTLTLGTHNYMRGRNLEKNGGSKKTHKNKKSSRRNRK